MINPPLEETEKYIGDLDIFNHNIYYSIDNQLISYDLTTGIKRHIAVENAEKFDFVFQYNNLIYGYDSKNNLLINTDEQIKNIGKVTDMFQQDNALYILDQNKLKIYNLSENKVEETVEFDDDYQQVALLKNDLYLLDENGKIIRYHNGKIFPLDIKEKTYSNLFLIDTQIFAPIKNTNKINVFE